MNSWLVRGIKHNFFVHAFVIGAAILVGYYGLWRAYFFSDDYWMLGWVRHEPSFAHAILAQFGYGVRFLLDALLYTRVKLYDLDPAPYYWSSLVQHFIVALIVYGLALLWTQRRAIALLTALLFATTFAHYEVVTWITGSEYSFAAALYLATLGQFALYLHQRRWLWYVGSLVTFIMLLLFLEMFLSLPLVLGAYHLILGRQSTDESIWSLVRWQTVWLHLPYWALMGLYLALQLSFVQAGSSEAVVARVRYGPGLHIPGNFYYLAYLLIPDVHYGVLRDWFGPMFVAAIRWLTLGVAVVGNGLALYGLWRGSPLVRFAIAFIYLTFLPYTLWEGAYAGAIRYRYLPAIGFSLLVALFLMYVYGWFRENRNLAMRNFSYAAPIVIIGIVLFNLTVVQIWVRQHVENSRLRQTFVTEFVADYGDVQPDSLIYIEVPAVKYSDLNEACTLIFEHDVHCKTVWDDRISPDEVSDDHYNGPVYWLRITDDGLQQILPLVQRAE